tara:strand:- start:9416 stop:9859 length:444 start_codon:yes stop_codon:yes gene_type:complete
MKIKKTVGSTTAIGRKSYTIHTESGNMFKAVPAGTKSYDCNGHRFSTIKAIKYWIENLDEDFDQKNRAEEETQEDQNSMNEEGNLWDSLDPCAILIKGMMEYGWVLGASTTKTLDNFGWLNEDGSPDTDKADREHKRYSTLNNKLLK